MSRLLKTISIPLFCVILASGCTMLGPDYQEPPVTVESRWGAVEDSKGGGESPVDTRWWESAFQDPELDRLVAVALEQNLSLRSAGLRVLQSQQQLAIAIGNQYPQQQQVTGSAAREKSGGVVFNEYNLGFNVSWEADFWGRFARQIESASADLDASVASYDGVLISLIAQVAENYTLVRTFQDRLKVSRENIVAQEESLRIAQAKANAGEVSELDADQASSLVNNTRATALSLETSLRQTKNSLAILLGQLPQELDYLLAQKGGVPLVKSDIALGMPQDLIRRRPDIRVAERQLAAQSAQIGFAEAELYPHFSIGGSIGTSADSGGDLFNSDSESWNLFGLFEWNIFNYGRLKSNVRLQDARFQQLLVDYRDTVLQAQGDVENAIIAYLKSSEQLESYRLAAAASRRALKVSTAQYQNGLINFNTVLSTLGAHLQQQDLLASARGDVASNLVNVYKALGGGWELRENRDPVDLLPAVMKAQMRTRTDAWEGLLQ
ncbi:efflux transporter outer membrane subunit [Aestuariirhabdus sp. LZHN29]|uniref:efflux transporter outer membrane subunit n=1 Tax=Aestuariirhabdus sp. LZHN29 TaxID=3417462 RepID=UPI003CF4F492